MKSFNKPVMGILDIQRRMTKSASVSTIISWVVPIVVFASVLLADAVISQSDGFFSQLFKDLRNLCWNSDQQRMLYACLAMYFVILLVRSNRDGKPGFSSLNDSHLWLVVTMAIGSVAYGLHYAEAAGTPRALVFLFGPVLGLGALDVTRLGRKKQRSFCPLLCALTGVLFLCSVWKRDSGFKSNYLGQQRWSGPWNNPNLFGLLVGVGLVLLLGIGFSFVGYCKSQGAKTESAQWTKLRLWTLLLLWLGMAVAMSLALLRSYSRGAWLATLCGLACLGFPVISYQSSVFGRWIRSNKASLAVIICALAVLALWQFQQPQPAVARRASSVGNVNDFSWRNRIAAWEGALQIMAEQPWLGAGWNQPEPLYEHYYLPRKLTENAAIQTNDYLMLGATLGIPALFCFGMYLWLSLEWNEESRRQPAESVERSETLPLACGAETWRRLVICCPFPQIICRAGGTVLLVGFWFDGGVFELATASLFWIMPELGRADSVQHR